MQIGFYESHAYVVLLLKSVLGAADSTVLSNLKTKITRATKAGVGVDRVAACNKMEIEEINMTTSFQPPSSIRKVIVQVVEACDLLPKDGQGSSSPYVMVEFDGQTKRTTTKFKELNPVWNETLEFIIFDPDKIEFQVMEIEVYNDKKYENGSRCKNQFLGKVKLYGAHFAKRGDETLVSFALERKSVFSWIRGEIGLKIYYYNEFMNQDQNQTHTVLLTQQNLIDQE
ncbi:Protein QUIRKY [Senna tora]|uniref:Protein QUIRKY n=1 Tax=Senna tora TaxID=362788 RepID=A0A834TZD0_9FABA|nr:Protein QUIRKY [Senna tora]